MAKKTAFHREADRIMDNIYGRMRVAMRRSLSGALADAQKETEHDSSNAAFHWMIIAGEKTQRTSGYTVTDRRGQNLRGGVGTRGDQGINKSKVDEFVAIREKRNLLRHTSTKNKGRFPEQKFVLWHGLLPPYSYEKSDRSARRYAKNANVLEAGKAGMKSFREFGAIEASKAAAKGRG